MLPVPDSPRIRMGTSTRAKASISAKSACIGALRPMIPWKEDSSGPAMRARPIATGVSGDRHGRAQPHENYLVGLGVGHYFDCDGDCGPLALLPRSKCERCNGAA